ncbi:MAG: HlyD family efflux transporter periplasmic adaptor subunit [Flavobacteriales bacterium]|nr:HlyD family efflux transporter periplasmic adaptor subunit [Flavobacteriales bacterium]
MKTSNKITSLFILLTALWSCNKDAKADAYGNFEATETTISAQANGQLLQFNIDEGVVLKAQQVIGYIDTIPLFLKKQQLLAQKQIVFAKSKGVLSQIDVLKAQLKTAMANLDRTKKLVESKSATPKQLDDVSGQVSVLNQQIKSIETQNVAVVNEAKSISAQLNQVKDQIAKSFIINPLDGTVLTTYAEQSEVVTFGKPLYKLADLSRLELRVYIGESQLTSLKIGQEVSVKVDSQKEMKTYKGTISWIASEAEFTPKIIQTKEERVNLVYAVKLNVNNDGSLKIGMPAEMWISQNK